MDEDLCPWCAHARTTGQTEVHTECDPLEFWCGCPCQTGENADPLNPGGTDD